MKAGSLIFFLFFAFAGYSQTMLHSLIKEAEGAHEVFSGLPFFKDDFFPLDSIAIPGHHADSIRKQYQFDQMVSEDGKKVQGYAIHDYLHGLLIKDLLEILSHPDLSTEWVSDSLSSFQVLLSPDKRLLNIAFDENTGGSYRSRISFLAYYSQNGILNWISYRDSDDSMNIHPDGFQSIDTIHTNRGIAYLLMGNVIGCNTCYEDYLQLILPTEKGMTMLFNLSVVARDWEDKIQLDEETHNIIIRYKPDDLSNFSCPCNNIQYSWESEEPCICHYLWTGSGFEIQFQE